MTTVRRLALVLGLLAAATASAHEGMWTFHNPPRELLKERFGFELTQSWLDHVQQASVRFNSGGSGSFVSPHGLVLTNHHVGLESIHKLSTPEEDLVANGFCAWTQEEERRCPDLELNVVVNMVDVTARVKDAVADGASDEEATLARRAEIGRIEQEARDASGLRSNVVSLYHGGEYWLYQYQQYTDVRLVFAPEESIGFFGGDPDNFTYPRFNLDFALFRVYEDGKPIASPYYLPFNPHGVAEGDLVFVSGNPGRTDRQLTVAQLEDLRDRSRPRSMDTIEHLRQALHAYAAQGPEQKRQTGDLLMSIENTRKAYTGEFEGLRDPALMQRKRQEEARLKEAVAHNPDLQDRVGDPWTEIAEAVDALAPIDQRLYYSRLRGDLPGLAQGLVRRAIEAQKPNEERLPAYRDSNQDSLRLRLLSEAPLHLGMERVMLQGSLELAARHLSPQDPFVKATLGDRTPAAAAEHLLSGTRLMDVAERTRLWEGGLAAVQASDDPLIQVYLSLDPMLRNLEGQAETLGTRITLASARISEARFAVLGNDVYPDATFTLRLAFGTVKGYEEDTTLVPWKTTFYGLYGRAHSFDFADPFGLPRRFLDREAHVDLSTPLDFVHTADITGGNSGSPTINRAGELVGLIFDGNIQSLPNQYVFGDGADRAVSVHAAGILEALADIYQAQHLVGELTASRGQ